MSFVKQFNAIVTDPKVRDSAQLFLDEGNRHELFINYVGVNYNDSDLVSVKLYFSFLQPPSEDLFSFMDLEEHQRTLVNHNWKPSDEYQYMHQGLTFGLKCYLNNSEVSINPYLHFRCKELALGDPEQLLLNNQDKENYPGICYEKHHNSVEQKKYFYITSQENKINLLDDFNLTNEIDLSALTAIEYTDTPRENKVNLSMSSSDAVYDYLKGLSNSKIMELCQYFYEHYGLYVFCPGVRKNSSTKAIYFVPKEAYYALIPMQTLKQILTHTL